MSSPLIPLNTAAHLRRHKITRKGFQLTILVCGRSGTGKSTFINTLCDTDIATTPEKTTEITVRNRKIELGESDGTIISLSIVDTPGFGEHIDNSGHAETIVKYLESQFDSVLQEETRVRRNPKFEDNRVHVCLYFLSPSPRGLNELDIETIQKLAARVNVIPVVGKADTMTDKELLSIKSSVMENIESHNLPIFTFNYDLDNNYDQTEENDALREMLPFAVVGANTIYQVNDEFFRGRRYPWGFVQVENPMHSDFIALRSVLFGSHIQDLKDSTLDIIYEKYRTEKLSKDPQMLARLSIAS
ncbi:septin [Starmerella bacillaris]|uniref:Septin n=1 Tax=Starmerella bacillaris TaxID=1247836 RepID=A0AAV5RR92_STABA|nr:septin [Starmerella bacillaris]